ncbi:MAG: hypothetical protein D6B27_05870 [Gammaproteobacteria bacterium]|nr:MAG: hypothetical protein D6B27_05870 [Gammaproteobacteria bacterium]
MALINKTSQLFIKFVSKPWLLFFLALFFALSSIKVPLAADDYFHYVALKGSHQLQQLGFQNADGDIGATDAAMTLFSFFPKDRTNINRMKEIGVYPWWGSDEVQLSFWRPLASISHWLDYKLWPDSIAMMHLHSIFWFMLYLLSGYLVFKHLFKDTSMNGKKLAAFGLLFLVVDLSLYESLGWIASRNALMAGSFGLLSFYFMLLTNSLKNRILSLVFFGLALLSAEAGIGSAGLIMAYILFISPESIKKKIITFAPYLLLVVLWRICYQSGHYGALNNGLYVDPIKNFKGFVEVVFTRGPALILNQISGVDMLYNLFSPLTKVIYAVIGAAIFLLTLILNRQFIKEVKLARFFLVGALFSVVPPVAIGMISGRLLIFVSVMMFGFFILAFNYYQNKNCCVYKAYKVVYLGFNIFISFIALLCLSVYLYQGMVKKKNNDADIIFLSQDLSEKRVYLISSPHSFQWLYLPYQFSYFEKQLPESARILTSSYESIDITRTDENKLKISIDSGMKIYTDSVAVRDTLFSNYKHLISLGYKRSFPDVTIEVIAVNENSEPTEIIYSFKDINSSTNLWYYWDVVEDKGKYKKFTLPDTGKTVKIDGINSL